MAKTESIKKVSLKPLMGYCLVKPSEADTKTAAGIILPEGSQEKPAQGTVISVGPDQVIPGGTVINCPVKVGDVVVYKKWGGDEVRINGEDLKLVSFSDLMGVLE